MTKIEKRAINSIFLHRIIYGIASSAISVFIPLILYLQTDDIKLAVMFSVAQRLISGVVTVALRRFMIKNQLLSMLISIVPLIAIQIILAFFNINLVLIIILVLLAGFVNPLYFIPLNIHFALQDKRHNVAKFQTGSILGKILFIILAGYMLGTALESSLIILCIFASAIFIVSIIPLLKNYAYINKKMSAEANKSFGEVNKSLKRENIFHTFFGLISQIIGSILPLYLIFNNISIDLIAYVVAITETIKIGSNYFAKYLKAKNLDIISYLIFTVVFFISSIMILFTNSSEALFSIGIVLGITFPFLFVPAFTNYCNKLRNEHIVANGMIARDLYVLTPRAFVYLIFFFIPSFNLLFIIGAVSSVGLFFSRIKSYNKKTT